VVVVSTEVRSTGATAAAVLILLKAAAPEKGDVKAA
jgi:hypothetical protein